MPIRSQSGRDAFCGRFALLAFSSLILLAAAPVAEAGIDAVRGKTYGVTQKHGPWMIMVASFTEPPPEFRKAGMTPRQAADELIFELRSKGIPAYIFELGSKVEKIETVDTMQNPDTRVYASRRGSVCVLAGNYPSAEDKTAVETLAWMKKFRPKFLSAGQADETGMVGLANGGTYHVSKNAEGKTKGPLSGAFLTINPSLSIDEVRSQQVDRDLISLNAGEDNTLLENTGKYTLVIASFYGNSVTQIPGSRMPSATENFRLTDSLKIAAQQAYELAYHMRTVLKYDAYVWHDRYKSVVTVGTFESPDDPRIATAMAIYGAKLRLDPATNREVLTAEILTIPTEPTDQDPLRKKWMFDPQPTLMPVPKLSLK